MSTFSSSEQVLSQQLLLDTLETYNEDGGVLAVWR
jgi:hypothetical protein